jgi:DnaJ like chaperone protein
MSIWQRITESLSVIGTSIAAYLGQIARARATPPEKSLAFTIGMIALGAKMAKADGVVTEVEVQAFKRVFHVPQKDLAAVARVFNLAKQDVAGFDAYAKQIARLFHAKSTVLEDVLDGLFHIAKADDALHRAELHFLEQVALIFGFEKPDFARIRARHVVGDIEQPYVVLGVPADATIDDIKKRYRKLVRDNHPDKHIAAGVPPEMIALATARLQKINEAYAQILQERMA